MLNWWKRKIISNFTAPKSLIADNMPLLIIKLKLDFIHSYVCGGFINRLNISVFSHLILLKIKRLNFGVTFDSPTEFVDEPKKRSLSASSSSFFEFLL